MKLSFLAYLATILWISVNSEVLAQTGFQLENWKTHSSMLDVRDVTIDSQGRIWSATPGGVFIYNPSNGEIREFRNIGELLSLDATCIRANHPTKEIYIGSFDGIINIVTEDFEWSYEMAIKKSSATNPVIKDIVFKNNIAYIAGGFGLTTYDMKDRVFLQTPPRLGTFQEYTQVNKLMFINNELWTATNSGVAKIDLNKPIINPDSWINYTSVNGLTDVNISGLILFENNIYCTSDSTIYKFSLDSFITVIKNPVWDVIGSMSVFNNNLIISTPFNVRDLSNKLYFEFVETSDSAFINAAYINPNDPGTLIVLTKSGFIIKNITLKHIKPDSPYSNMFMNLAVDIYGNLWTATDTDKSFGMGIMMLSNAGWQNFNVKNTPSMPTDDYQWITAIPDGRIVFSSWGRGIAIAEKQNGTYSFKYFDNKNAPFTGLPTAPDYVVTGRSAYDPLRAKLWIINYAPSFNAPLLISIDSKGAFSSFMTTQVRTYKPLAIDISGTKWIGSSEGEGLVYFNEINPDNPSDDISGRFTPANSLLQSTTINCLAFDKSGVLWIGTAAGLSYCLLPSAVLKNANPIIKPSFIKILANQSINDIMIDAIGNKWIATNQGVWIIDPDGAIELAQINTTNSPIISNEVLSLATNEQTGQVFMGTRNGLTEVMTFSVKPLDKYSIICYPQPYNPGTDGNLIIEGLGPNSDLRILTIDGNLVKAITTTSQIITWDGTDMEGNPAESGVYIIVGTSGSSEEAGLAKFVLLRK